jgi:hypothetical protein
LTLPGAQFYPYNQATISYQLNHLLKIVTSTTKNHNQ